MRLTIASARVDDGSMSPPSVVVVHHTRKLAIASLIAVAPACFIEITPLDDDGATTGNDPACSYGTHCNGVFIYCQNGCGSEPEPCGRVVHAGVRGVHGAAVEIMVS